MSYTLTDVKIENRKTIKQHFQKNNDPVDEYLEELSACLVLSSQFFLQTNQDQTEYPLRILTTKEYMEVIKKQIRNNPERLAFEQAQFKEDSTHIPLEIQAASFLEMCGFLEGNESVFHRPMFFDFSGHGDPFFTVLGFKVGKKLLDMQFSLEGQYPGFIENLFINRQAVLLDMKDDTREIISSDEFSDVPLFDLSFDRLFDPDSSNKDTIKVRFNSWYNDPEVHWSTMSSLPLVRKMATFITRKYPQTRLFNTNVPTILGLTLSKPDGTFNVFAIRHTFDPLSE
jgi:hypothetical protein